MVNLILNENMKLYRRPRTWAMVGLLIAAVLLGSIIDWYDDGKSAQGDSWRDQVMQDKQRFVNRLQEPNLNEESKTYFQERIAVYDYHLEHNIHPTHGTMWDVINGGFSADLIVLITVFAVIVAGDSLAGEFTTGTIKLLLIRPVSRFRILVSKYLSMIMFGLVLLVILFIVSVLVNGLIYHFEHMDLPLVSMDANGQIIERNMVANVWKTYLLNGISTIVFVTMAFMISSTFRSSIMAISISIVALFATDLFMELLQPYEWSKYMLFANIDLTQYLRGRPYQEGMTLTFSIIVLSIHFILFNMISWLVFTRRDVAA